LRLTRPFWVAAVPLRTTGFIRAGPGKSAPVLDYTPHYQAFMFATSRV
jgi:hypothetical protein